MVAALPMLKADKLFVVMLIVPPVLPLMPAALAATVLENRAFVAALTVIVPPSPPIVPTAPAVNAPVTLTLEPVEVRLKLPPLPLVGATKKLAPAVTVKVPLELKETVPPAPVVEPPPALTMTVVAVPAVNVPPVTCTEMLPPLPVVPPVALSASPLVLNASVEPLRRMLLVGIVPKLPEPEELADRAT